MGLGSPRDPDTGAAGMLAADPRSMRQTACDVGRVTAVVRGALGGRLTRGLDVGGAGIRLVRRAVRERMGR
jgi:hypothetical protein